MAATGIERLRGGKLSYENPGGKQPRPTGGAAPASQGQPTIMTARRRELPAPREGSRTTAPGTDGSSQSRPSREVVPREAPRWRGTGLQRLRQQVLTYGSDRGEQPRASIAAPPVSVPRSVPGSAPKILAPSEKGTSVRRTAPPAPRATVPRDLPARRPIPRERPRPLKGVPREYQPVAYENQIAPMGREEPFYETEPDIEGWPHGEMIDMARTPEEIKEKTEEMTAPMPLKVPQYPYGLCISLDDDSLEKLGLAGDLPDVGDILEVYVTAKVTCASKTENIDPATNQPKSCSRIELQIVGMLPHEEEPEEVDRAEEEEARSRGRRQRFYGGDGEGLPSYDAD